MDKWINMTQVYTIIRVLRSCLYLGMMFLGCRFLAMSGNFKQQAIGGIFIVAGILSLVNLKREIRRRARRLQQREEDKERFSK